MKFNWITSLIIASALAILTLIVFQVRWIQHSQTLLEEQFNQRVNMALCNTVEKLSGEEKCSQVLQASCSPKQPSNCCRQLDTLLESEVFDQTLGTALAFYQIDLPYQAKIQPNSVLDNGEKLPPYSCTLNPLITAEGHFVQLDFETKQEYFLSQMGEMLGSSIFILLFICTIFGLATYHLIRQKKMSDQNRDFFNHMAHEFRTPLTNIRLASSMLLKKNEQLENSPFLGIIKQEGDHLMQQVEQVLHLARLEKKDFQLQLKPTDISGLIRQIVKRMHLQQLEHSADIHLEMPDRPIVYHADPLHLGNAIRNLLDNSFKYCSEWPKILISVSQVNDGLRLRLQDNGCGLGSHEEEKVFEKFYQGKSSENRKGFGLGLAYVKRVIELHGGTIISKSHHKRGTEFEINLPLQPEPA